MRLLWCAASNTKRWRFWRLWSFLQIQLFSYMCMCVTPRLRDKVFKRKRKSLVGFRCPNETSSTMTSVCFPLKHRCVNEVSDCSLGVKTLMTERRSNHIGGTGAQLRKTRPQSGGKAYFSDNTLKKKKWRSHGRKPMRWRSVETLNADEVKGLSSGQ